MSILISTTWLQPLRRRVMRCGWYCCFLGLLASGCTAFHPVRGVPASYLPAQYAGISRDNMRTIDLSLLVRNPPDQYRVAAGDVISIYVPRVLGSQSTEVATVGIEPPINLPASIEDPPTVGYPIQVRDDNTISLPQIRPLQVGGMTLHQVEEAIKHAYTVESHILNPAEALVMVSLQRPRVHRVLVVRQEAATTMTTSSMPGTVNIGTSGKGTARTVTLKAYENDVLHALALVDGVDGLPGLNAENAIYIIRRRPRVPAAGCPIPPTPPAVVPIPDGPALEQHPGGPLPPLPPVQTTSYEQPPEYRPYGGYRSGGVVPAATTTSTRGPVTLAEGHSLTSAGTFPAMTPGSSLNALEGHSFGSGLPPVTPYSPDMAPPVPALPPGDAAWPLMLQNFDPTIDNPNITRIPIRLAPGEVPQITEEQVTLNDGDIIFIDSRETEVFYTAGLLGGGQFTLPRDYDLGVLEAVSIAEGRATAGTSLNRSIGGVSALNHDVSNSASRLVLIRTLPNGKRINIEVNLNKAMRYPHENIRVLPGDILLLEYTFPEAILACTQRYLFEGALFGLAASVLTTGR